MLFKYEPGSAHKQFKEQGYVHLKDVLADDFVDYMTAFYEETQKTASGEAEDWKVYGKKRQYVFEFPSQAVAEEFRDGLAALTGISPDGFTISERHLKVYDEAANPWPAPHKDRAASEVSIGLPVKLPEGSTVCVFPELQFGPNPEEKAVFMTDRDHPDLEHIYQKETCVMLNESIGDLVVFLGSSIFHERVKAAGAAILYIKVNGDGRDPLGENIFGDKSVAEAL
ncbi:hypothetical protein [Henriciella pelagia]|jgi:hypothetical protein|uniref:Phytanoyl-CoA dioxygenase n=1 Tax=Henriciella pelagia TaxID=1977912 RepID=A0ABQ1JFR4_9PROT|nr:hypothetical protein [Henriciella pelagia]GGB67875.1 hypothetical protein GCM10011503_15690 [Henriciella pelagia]